jgi:hypothetical protein
MILPQSHNHDCCDVLVLSAPSRDGVHIVKWKRKVPPTAMSEQELLAQVKTIEATVGKKITEGRWC